MCILMSVLERCVTRSERKGKASERKRGKCTQQYQDLTAFSSQMCSLSVCEKCPCGLTVNRSHTVLSNCVHVDRNSPLKVLIYLICSLETLTRDHCEILASYSILGQLRSHIAKISRHQEQLKARRRPSLLSLSQSSQYVKTYKSLLIQIFGSAFARSRPSNVTKLTFAFYLEQPSQWRKTTPKPSPRSRPRHPRSPVPPSPMSSPASTRSTCTSEYVQHLEQPPQKYPQRKP